MTKPSRKPIQKPSQANLQKNTEAQSNISVSNEVVLDAVNPIPFEMKGDPSLFWYDGQKEYIPFLNPKDNFFSVLQEASLLSPTSSACINSKVFFCSGNGIKIKDFKDDSPLGKEWKKFQKRINNRRQSLGKIGDKFFSNYFRVGNVFIEIVKAQAGKTKKVYAHIHSFLDCRLGKPDENDIPQEVLISTKFRKDGTFNIIDNAISLPIYNGEDTNWKTCDDGTQRCMIHIKNEMDGYDYYGIPENVSSIIWQILESEGASYNLDNFLNNMVIGGAVILQGNFTDAELTNAARRIVHQHTGKGKRGRWTVMASKQGPGTIQNFTKETDASFLKLDENAEQKIIDSNNWDSSLYGQNNSKGLGNGGNAYLKQIFKIKHKTVVEPTREIFFEEFLIPFLEIVDEWTGSKWMQNEFVFESINIEDLVDEIDVNSVITVDEGREKLGMDKLENDKGKLIISEIKKNNNVQTQQDS